MEDKNFEPLVPDMLYRHVLEEEPQPEALMAEAMLPLSEVGDDIPLPEEALTEEPAPAEVVTEDTVAGEFSAGDAAADMSAGDTLLFPIIPEDAVQTVSPAAEEEEAIPLDAYVPNVELPFEDGSFLCFEKWHDYLTCKFGEYMQLPPEEDRTWKHHPIVIDFDRNLEDLE